MAIEFVDKEPEDGGKPKKAPMPKPREPSEAAADSTQQSFDDLPFAKLKSKQRGRKKPLK